MDSALTPEAAAVHDLFTAAYVPYAERAIAAHGIRTPSGWDGAMNAGRRWLADALRALLERPLGEQRRSPLEVFQEALRFPTDALAAAGVEPVDRDETARRLLPGDRYDLAPTSSRQLGDDAWRAHLAWGVAKAKDVAGAVPAHDTALSLAGHSPQRPVVALVGTDLMDRSRIEPIVRAAGLSLEIWRNPAAIEAGLADRHPVVVLVDLTHPAADEAIRAAAGASVRTYAFGPHVDDVAHVRARSLGATDAYARSRFFRVLPDLMPRLV